MKRFLTPRFSLRMLFVAITVLSILFFAWTTRRDRFARQQRICEQLVVSLGGKKPIWIDLNAHGFGCGAYARPQGVEFFVANSKSWTEAFFPGGLREVTSVHITHPDRDRLDRKKWREAVMREIVKLDTLQSVDVESDILDAEDIGKLRQLPELTSLTLSVHPLTDEMLAYIGEMRKLEVLSIGGSSGRFTSDSVTGRGLENLARLSAVKEIWFNNVDLKGAIFGTQLDLRKVVFFECEISPEVLAGLAGCRHLESLSVSGQLSESRATSIASIPALRVLLIYGEACDEGLLALCASKSIEVLSMWGCDHVTERGFAALASLPLKSLDLDSRSTPLDCGMLGHIARIRSLRDVTLPVGSVSDAQLAIISQMTNIEHLTLDAASRSETPTPALTTQQLSSLQARLPNATISDSERERMQSAQQAMQSNQNLAAQPNAANAGQPVTAEEASPAD